MKAEYSPLLGTQQGAGKLHIHKTRLTSEGGDSRYVHSHGAEETMYIFEGEGEFIIDGVISTAGAGEVVFFPSGSIHGIRRVISGEMHYLTIRTVEEGDEPCCCVEGHG